MTARSATGGAAAPADGRYGIFHDSTKCIACLSCQRDCRRQNNLPPEETLIRFDVSPPDGSGPDIIRRRTCYHCTEAQCVLVCPTGATVKGPSGLTHHFPDKCAGCGYCVAACPFGVPELTKRTAFNQRGAKVRRCNGCPDRVANGQPPACVLACPTGALTGGPRDELWTRAEERLRAVRPELPGARLYGLNMLEGLGLVTLLAGEPELYGLPPEPEVSRLLPAWKDFIQPFGLYVSAAALLVTALTFPLARRNHLRELAEAEKEGRD